MRGDCGARRALKPILGRSLSSKGNARPFITSVVGDSTSALYGLCEYVGKESFRTEPFALAIIRVRGLSKESLLLFVLGLLSEGKGWEIGEGLTRGFAGTVLFVDKVHGGGVDASGGFRRSISSCRIGKGIRPSGCHDGAESGLEAACSLGGGFITSVVGEE